MPDLNRRTFVIGTAAATLSGRLFAQPSSAPLPIRIASNQGTENAALQQLMTERGFARRLGLEIALVESGAIEGPIEALEAGRADVCMISAYAGVLPAIEAGKPVRLIGSAMQLPALAVCSANDSLRTVRDLAGRRIGIGETDGLLHLVMLALLRHHGMPSTAAEFVTVGSSEQVFRAVAAGAVDAGPCGVAALSDRRIHILNGGALWDALPEFTYQFAYASTAALATRSDAIARCLAAYTLLFRFVSSPRSRAAYLEARQAVGGDMAEGQAVWDFIQHVRPYAPMPGLSPAHVAYLQRLNVRVGLQRQVVPFDRVANLAPAAAAKRMLLSGLA